MRPVFHEQKISGNNQEPDENQFGFGKHALAVIAFMLMLMIVLHGFTRVSMLVSG